MKINVELSHETVDDIIVTYLMSVYDGYYDSWDDPADKAKLVLAAKEILMFHLTEPECVDYFGHGWQ